MQKYKFSDIVINSTAKKQPVDSDKNVYIGLEHLSPDTFLVEKYGADMAPKGEKLIMKKGDVLFGKRRAYQKKVGIAPCDGIFSAHGMVLRPKEDIVDKDFFPFFIKSDYFLDKAIEISVGSLSPTINWGDLKELEFYLPSLEKQKEQGDILWKVENLIECSRKALNKCDEFMDSMYRKLISCGKDGQISDICNLNIESVKRKLNGNDYINYIEISSINDESHEIENITNVPLSKAPTSAKQVVECGDILVSLVRPNLRKNALYGLDLKNPVATSGFCILRPENKIYKNFMLCIVNSNDFVDAMMNKTSGSTYPTIKCNDVLNYEIKIPNSADIKEFNSLYDKIYKIRSEIKSQIEKNLKLKNSILNNLFSNVEE